MASKRLSHLLVILLGAVVLGLGVWWLLDMDDEGGDPTLSAAEPWEAEGPELTVRGRTAERHPRGGPAGHAKDRPRGGGSAGAAPGAGRPLAQAPEPVEGRIVGVVTDAEGRPIAGATVTLTEPVVRGSASPTLSLPATHSTDARGQFVYDAPKQGSYQMRVAAQGFITRRVSGQSGAAAVRVELAVAMTLAGVLLEKGTGAPLANLDLHARAVKAGRVGGTSVAARTNEDGRFSFQVPRGEPHFIEPTHEYPSEGQAPMLKGAESELSVFTGA